MQEVCIQYAQYAPSMHILAYSKFYNIKYACSICILNTSMQIKYAKNKECLHTKLSMHKIKYKFAKYKYAK